MSFELRVGTRASVLALTQTRVLCERLRGQFPDLSVIEVLIKTEGDGTTEPLSASKTPGVFVSALRDALLENRVDFIVHSMKDLPAKPHAEIVTACVPQREDARDGLVSRENLTLAELAPGAVVGTSSPRRAASLRRHRPDLSVVNIRGNIDTRIAKVMRGDVDATLLAMAGLNRIGRAGAVAETFDNHDFVPAPGQGALAVECRAGDEHVLAMLQTLNDDTVQLITTAERSVLLGLDAGCSTAIGASADFNDGLLTLTAELAVEETGEAERVQVSAPVELGDLSSATQLGLRVAQQLRSSPIGQKVKATFNVAPAKDEPATVLLIRANRNEADERALAKFDITSRTDPYLSITSSGNMAGARRMLDALRADVPTWLIATSTNALAFFEQLLEPGELHRAITENPRLRFAAIGAQTRAELLQRGASDVIIPSEAYGESLAEVLVATEPCQVVIPSGSISMNTLNNALSAHGFSLLSEVVYNTEPVAAQPKSVEEVTRGIVDAVLFRSPSAVRAFEMFNGIPDITVFCAGRTTARQAEQLGFTVAAVSHDPAPKAVAETVATYLKGSA